MVLCFVLEGRFWSNDFLNFFIFGANLDSAINDVGLLVVSAGLPGRRVSFMSSVSSILNLKQNRVRDKSPDGGGKRIVADYE
jgi:hypothetical protein